MKLLSKKFLAFLISFALVFMNLTTGILTPDSSTVVHAQELNPLDTDSALLVHYTFDEGSGTTANDSSGNNAAMTIPEGASWIPGKIGPGALRLDTIDELEIPSSVLDSIAASGEYTASAWIKTGFSIGEASIGAMSEYSENALAGSSLQLDDWNHIVYTSDMVTTRLYVNGVFVAEDNSAPDTSSLFSGLFEAESGALSTNAVIDIFMDIDDFRIYSRILNQEEITALYDYQAPEPEDTEAPSAPEGLSATEVTETTVTLTWSESTDNIGVIGYDIYIGTELAGSSETTSFIVTGLTAATEYSFTVRAKDAAGNISEASEALVITTAVTPAPPTGNFTVDGTRILDPNGNEFIIKGTNVNGPGWPWGRLTVPDVGLMADVWKFNFTRVNCATFWGYNHNNDDLDAIVDAITSKGMVAMLETHELTGKYPTETSTSNTPSIQQLTNWWVSIANKYKDNPYVWFNIMNEPGGSEDVPEAWKTVHETVIQAIRATGAQNIIVLDGHQFGQENGGRNDAKSGILTYGEYFKNNYDNIVFSLHMYYEWTDGEQRLNDYLDKVEAKGLPIFIGEYGGNNGDQAANSVTAAMFNVCIPRNIGRVVWHWVGDDIYDLTAGTYNGGGWEVDRTDGSKPTNLSWMGNLIWDDNRGLLSNHINDAGISDISINKSIFNAGDKVRFIASVQNTGLMKFPADSSITVKFLVNGAELCSKEVKGPFYHGEVKDILSDEWTADSSTANVEVVIDASASSYGTDSDISNNSRQTIFNGQPADSGFDIAIADVSFDKESITFGDTVRAAATIINQGSAPVTGKRINITFVIDGVQIGRANPTISLEPGKTQTIFMGGDGWKVTKPAAFQLMASITSDTGDGNTENEKLSKTMELSSTKINLVLNGSFEQNLSSWNNWGRMTVDTVNVKAGSKALGVTAGGAGGGGQSLTLKPNTTYMLSAWGKNDAEAAISTDIGVKYMLPDNRNPHNMLSFTETDYTFKKVVFTTPAEFTDCWLFIWKGDANVSFFTDDIQLVEVTNNIANHSFEQNMASWNNWGGASIITQEPDADVKSPIVTSKAIQIASGAAGGAGQFISLRPATRYLLSVWAKNDVESTHSTVGIKYELSGGGEEGHWLNFTGTEYENRQIEFNTPAAFTNSLAVIWKADTNANFIVDEIYLIELGPATEDEDTIAPVITLDQSGGTVNNPDYIISGTVSEPCTLKINGIDTEVGDDLKFSTAISLVEGTNHIVLEARDEAGNVGTVSLDVVYTPASEQVLELVLDKAIIREGEEVVVTIKVIGTTGLRGFNLLFDFDEELYDLVDAELAEQFGVHGDNAHLETKVISGKVRLVGTLLGEGSRNEDVELARITLRAKNGINAATSVVLAAGSTLSINNNQLYEQEADISRDAPIADPDVAGDDDRVRINDLSVVAAAFMKRSGDEGYNASYDMNKDGIIDLTDIVYIAKIILNS